MRVIIKSKTLNEVKKHKNKNLVESRQLLNEEPVTLTLAAIGGILTAIGGIVAAFLARKYSKDKEAVTSIARSVDEADRSVLGAFGVRAEGEEETMRRAAEEGSAGGETASPETAVTSSSDASSPSSTGTTPESPKRVVPKESGGPGLFSRIMSGLKSIGRKPIIEISEQEYDALTKELEDVRNNFVYTLEEQMSKSTGDEMLDATKKPSEIVAEQLEIYLTFIQNTYKKWKKQIDAKKEIKEAFTNSIKLVQESIKTAKNIDLFFVISNRNDSDSLYKELTTASPSLAEYFSDIEKWYAFSRTILNSVNPEKSNLKSRLNVKDVSLTENRKKLARRGYNVK